MIARKSVSPYVLLGIGIAGATYLSKQENRDRAIELFQNIKKKSMSLLGMQASSLPSELIEKAGHPNPYDDEDTRMVDEGALYAVDYYNKDVQG